MAASRSPSSATFLADLAPGPDPGSTWRETTASAPNIWPTTSNARGPPPALSGGRAPDDGSTRASPWNDSPRLNCGGRLGIWTRRSEKSSPTVCPAMRSGLVVGVVEPDREDRPHASRRGHRPGAAGETRLPTQTFRESPNAARDLGRPTTRYPGSTEDWSRKEERRAQPGIFWRRRRDLNPRSP